MEPEILKKGKKFHKRVQRDWHIDAEGDIQSEHSITFLGNNSRYVGRKGRIDIFVDQIAGCVAIVEIKSTDWESIKPQNRRRLVSRHRYQIWKYINSFLETGDVDIVPGIIYPKSPSDTDVTVFIEEYLNECGIQVVCYEDLPT